MKFYCRKVKFTRNGKLRQLSLRFQTLIFSAGDMVQNLESPGFSRRPWNMAVSSVVAATFVSKYKYKMTIVAIYLWYVAARTNCDTVPPTHKNIRSHQQNHDDLMPIYMYLQSWPSVNFTGMLMMLAFDTGMASVGDDFCSDVNTVSWALLLAMLQADQQHLRTMLNNNIIDVRLDV